MIGGGSGGIGGNNGCPQISGTAPMVPATTADGKPFCIDKTEVREAEYFAFLNNPPTVQQPVCVDNASFLPTCEQSPLIDAYKPITCVDWCDAYAYCKSVGKHLCGALGGGPLTFQESTDAWKSEWHAACSKAGALIYPYGNAFIANACNGVESSYGGLKNVGTIASCEGGFSGIFDMSGNVSEWIDSCDTSGNCAVRGGNSTSYQDQLTCWSNSTPPRMSTATARGFRCCY
jgi:formylglycine-generating enzyme required for sulfatase activity